MKTLLYITAALILIAAIIPVHAEVFTPCVYGINCQYAYNLPTGNYSDGSTITLTTAEANSFCSGLGKTRDYNDWGHYPFRWSNDTAGGGSSHLLDANFNVGSPSPNYTAANIYCSGTNYFAKVWYKTGFFPTFDANFTASPTQGTGPLSVAFTDTSLNTTASTTYNWSISPMTGVYPAASNTTKDFSAYFTENGNFTITHGVSWGTSGSDIETKTDYIWIYDSSATVTTPVWALDMYTGYPIQGSQVDIQDIQNSTWSNTTTGANGKGQITTLNGHTLNIYGSALGYDSADLLAQPAYGGGYQLVLVPSGFTNVTSGNVTLYITVVDDDGSARLSGAEVTGSYGAQYQSTTTSTAGTAQLIVPNNTAIRVSAFKSGYIGGAKTVSSGTGSGGDTHVDVEIRLVKSTVTPTVTQTTLPGGGTPTPTITILPGCEDPTSDACHSSENDAMMDKLRDAGPDIIDLCIYAIMLGLLGACLYSLGFKL